MTKINLYSPDDLLAPFEFVAILLLFLIPILFICLLIPIVGFFLLGGGFIIFMLVICIATRGNEYC